VPVPVFIGDEVSASGYRLAGLQVRIPAADNLAAMLAAACEDAPLVLLSASFAQQLPDAQLESLLARVSPPVVVVPDVRGRAGQDDVVTRMRRQLGVIE
jgi:vacuolar-type H+-ATPase subunit F/Vma7